MATVLNTVLAVAVILGLAAIFLSLVAKVLEIVDDDD